VNWLRPRLSEGLADVIRGVTFSQGDSVREALPGYVPVLRAGNISDRLIIDDGLVWVPPRFVAPQQRLRRNDIVMCTSSGSAALVGKCAISESDFDGSWGAFNAVIRVRDHIAPRYLYFWLQSVEFRNWRDRAAKGANIQNLRHSDLAALAVPLPGPSEQARIVELLDEADRLRRRCGEADAKAVRILPALFIKTFGDPASNPMKWNCRPIGELGSVQTGNTPPRARAEFYGSAIEWIKSDNINTPSHYLTRASECLSEEGRQVGRVTPPGSTLVTCIAGSPECIGNAALSRTEVAFNQQINAVAPKDGTDPFFFYVQTMVGKKLIQAASTGAMKGMVSKSRFAAIPFLDPPPNLQASFGRTCASTLESLELAMCSGNQLEALYATLLQRAFSGQLTANWREAHMEELLAEMEHQARALNLPLPSQLEAAA